MELIGNGLNKGSHMYFYSATQTAKKLLYYPTAIGEFHCNAEYNVERTRYDSVLVICVISGSITLVQNGVEMTVAEGELLIVDCYKEHRYFCTDSAHTLWVHFDGNNSRKWFDEISNQHGQKIKCTRQAAEYILNIIKFIKLNQSEYDISSELYSLICTISKGNDSERESTKASRIEEAKAFINSNFDRDISVNEIASEVHMSASYFSKIFKEATGFSPYDYLLAVRLDKAKEMLQKTDDSIQNIAYKTGFNSTSNFIYFFKKETEISPLKFKNIKFQYKIISDIDILIQTGLYRQHKNGTPTERNQQVQKIFNNPYLNFLILIIEKGIFFKKQEMRNRFLLFYLPRSAEYYLKIFSKFS